MNNDIIISLFLFGAWFITLILYQKKKKKIDAGSFTLLMYCLYALCSIRLLFSDYYSWNELKVAPYIYLYICSLIGMLPLLKNDITQESILYNPSMRMTDRISVVFIFCTLISLPSNLSGFIDGIRMIMTDASSGNEIYEESTEYTRTAGGSISNLPSVISNAFAGIGILLTFYYMTLNNRNKWIFRGLLLSCATIILAGVASGQRGPVIQPILVMIATYLMFKSKIPPLYNKAVKIFGIALLVAVSLPIIAVTYNRFDTASSDPLESTYYYVGQQNLYFNNYALDDNGIRYGDRTIPLFKRLLFIDNVPKNFFERRLKYPHLYVNDEVFITYVGDIAIDFGPILCFLFFLIYYFVVPRATVQYRGVLPFDKIILLHFVLYLVTNGGLKLYPYSDVGGNLKLAVYMILYVIFKNLRLKKQNT